MLLNIYCTQTYTKSNAILASYWLPSHITSYGFPKTMLAIYMSHGTYAFKETYLHPSTHFFIPLLQFQAAATTFLLLILNDNVYLVILKKPILTN